MKKQNLVVVFLCVLFVVGCSTNRIIKAPDLEFGKFYDAPVSVDLPETNGYYIRFYKEDYALQTLKVFWPSKENREAFRVFIFVVHEECCTYWKPWIVPSPEIVTIKLKGKRKGLHDLPINILSINGPRIKIEAPQSVEFAIREVR